METDQKTNALVQTGSKLPQQWDLDSLKLQRTDSGYEVSLYTDRGIDVLDAEKAITRLTIALPRMSPEFFVLLSEFIIKHNFTAKRLEDAVNHVISNFQYKELNISDIVRFDRRLKIYTITEVNDLIADKKATYNDFEATFIEEKKYYIRKTDKLK